MLQYLSRDTARAYAVSDMLIVFQVDMPRVDIETKATRS